MPFLDFRKGQISYDISGNGPAVVFLHGFLENREIWKDYSAQLSKNYRVVSIDLPGHGLSSNFGYCHSMDMMGEAVLAVLKSLKIRRFYLIGHSMGGYVSLAIAEFHPDKIKGLCLFHSTADNDSNQKKKERQKVMKVVQRNKKIFIRESIPNLFNTDYKPYKGAINSIQKMALSMSAQAIIAALEGMRIRNNREIVVKFAPYPVLYIIGENDNVLPSKKLIRESKLSGNAEYLLLENTGHMGFMESPESCFKAMKKLLRRKI